METEVQESKLAIIKGKMPAGWTVTLAKRFNVSRQYVSQLFHQQEYSHPIWDQIILWANEYDTREKQANHIVKKRVKR